MNSYSAKDIEVLEGLEPVRQRPGMYIGGTDENAYHHLVSEILDNAMDEAVAGFAKKITIELSEDNLISITDDGRGIPVDPHPKFPNKSALEVILTTLHSGGKFSGSKSYQTSGGLHGVGSSVVNALSSFMEIIVIKDGKKYRQTFAYGKPTGGLEVLGDAKGHGTKVTFRPDSTIFTDKILFKPKRIYRLARSKAFLEKGVRIEWKCNPELITEDMGIPATDEFYFPNGLSDFLSESLKGKECLMPSQFCGVSCLPNEQGKIEWALNWCTSRESFFSSYCNTVPTPEGGSHESGFKSIALKCLKSFGAMIGNKKAEIITTDDLFSDACCLLSLFYKTPQFQGQTKEKLSSPEVIKLIENALKDSIDLYLTQNTKASTLLLDDIIEVAESRLRSRKEKDIARKSATKRLRLPGKLTDCSSKTRENTEIFIVEGDSAGGTAKQSRNRELQAILPLRGKILNVASSSKDKIDENKELSDIAEALGCGLGKDFDIEKLRYTRVIIMTDADVDGAHIASLLMTFFYKQMPELISNGHLYIALPPLYKISGGGKSFYAKTDKELNEIIEKEFKNRKYETSRFKGLGEMNSDQLKDTTMNPKTRQLVRVVIPNRTEEDMEDAGRTKKLVEDLMGKTAESRYKFIVENAKFAEKII